MTNTEIATLISERIGPRPVPFDSVRGLALEIYQDLGGTEGDEDFEDIYAILLATIPLAESGGGNVIDDTSIRLDKTWSSSKINSEIEAHSGATYTAGQNIAIDASNNISALGYMFDSSNGSFATIYRQDEEDGGALVANTASGLGAVAEGYNTTASGNYGAHAEGELTEASGSCAHAEGGYTSAEGWGAHAEGNQTTASGNYSHAEGWYNTASGDAAHAEGAGCVASGVYSHSEGYNTLALSNVAHVEGYNTIGYAGHVEGYWNISDNTETTVGDKIYPSRYIHIAGNGYTNTRSNAYTLGLNGKGWYKSDVLCGGSSEDAPLHRLSNKQDLLTAGANITIQNNVISAVGGGSGASIDDNNVSTNTTWSSNKITNVLDDYATWNVVNTSLGLKQDTLIAGTNITIQNNIISAAGTDLSNYYTKTEVDTALAGKADKTELADYATITNVNTSLGNYYTKTEIDTALSGKVDDSDLSNYYTKTEIDTSINNVLANYSDTSTVNSSLALKADITYVDTNFVKLVVCTLAQYNALQVKDSSTLYIISDVQ